MLRVLIIAADPLARAGLAAMLTNEPDFVVVGQIALDNDDLVTTALVFRPDVLLLDTGWEYSSALARLDELRQLELPAVALIPESVEVADVFALGVNGILSRSAAPVAITVALKAVEQGLFATDPEFLHSVLPQLDTAIPPLVEPLTPRETEVLQLLAEGLTNKAIARRLEISEHTVKFHVNAIMSKFQAQSRTEAVVRGTQLGLVII